ncbi:sigma 54-interacting transcriptional regulator [Roseibacterium sp. SDUM158016]|uniref:sigma 54-interacting transcriptional regulator n=1 Tax=Roseicyclus sediminis TaxID=2980997 RepID=UPI0021CF26AE|nr:sigma 54-interacting transcriptional regulator [Roseibacterium sp. SDUM158016]MCU4653460.1 sigma 54-interacting transcriptional regulator [Roseibacterium sp. SDUM158016]
MLDTPPLHDSLVATVPEAALVLDTATDRIVAANAAARRMLGAAPGAVFSDWLGRALPRFIVFMEETDHRGEAWTRDVDLLVAGEALPCELRARRIAGSASHVFIMLLDLAELERRAQMVETVRLHRAGIEEWKRAHDFFAELERQNQLILNAAGEGIYGVNAEGKTTFVNRAAQEMLGWTTEDLLGKPIHDMIHHHHLDGEVYHAHDCPIYRSFRFEQVNRIEDEVFWRKDGRPIRVEYVSTPIYDQQVLAGAVVIFRDITERKENEKRLHDALEEIASLRDRLEQENAYLQEAITTERAHHDIIGTSPAVRQLLTRVELVAGTDATVLISGEAGTGKALVAHAIHNASPRRRRPLIHVRCGSVAPGAMEAELFGQIRGAYPGALRDKPGKLELAHGGTLFLDDVEELPAEVQGQLLRALQEREVTRLGDTRSRSLDVRVIAASTKPLEKEVAAGRLREDLYLWLNVFPILCHPLREKKEDIPALATHLLGLASKRMNRRPPVITQHVMQRLMDYPWPGNVRELRNVIERATIVSQGGKLIVDLGEPGTRSRSAPGPIRTEADLEAEMRRTLVDCLRETGGKVSGTSGAAELMGIPATTFYSRIRKFGIKPEEWQITTPDSPPGTGA